MVAARAVSDDEEIVVVSSDGIVIRQPVKQVSRQKRESTGVRVMNLEDDAQLSAVAIVGSEDNGEPDQG
jgi:DNA gyrase subunit A